MDRIEREVGVTVVEGYFDDNKIVDMIKVVSQTFFCDVSVDVADDQVSSGANANLVGNVPR